MLRLAKRLLAFTAVATVLGALSFASVASAGGRVHVHGYFRSNGTYVMPHYRSAPDGNFWNNWSTLGNVNPYTGELGTRTEPSYRSYSYPTYSNYLVSPYHGYSYPSYRAPRYPSYAYPYPTYSPPRYEGDDSQADDKEVDDSGDPDD